MFSYGPDVLHVFNFFFFLHKNANAVMQGCVTRVLRDWKTNKSEKLELYNVSSYFSYGSSVEMSREPSVLTHFQEIFMSRLFFPKQNLWAFIAVKTLYFTCFYFQFLIPTRAPSSNKHRIKKSKISQLNTASNAFIVGYENLSLGCYMVSCCYIPQLLH